MATRAYVLRSTWRFAHTVAVCAVALAGCFDEATTGEDAGMAAGSGGTGGASGMGGSSGSAGVSGSSAMGGAGGGGAAGTGSGGGSGSAGSMGGMGGNDADAGVVCMPCTDELLGWGHNGGFVAFTERSELSFCNDYQHTRSPAGDPSQISIECGRALPCMGSGLHGVSDVLDALAHPDVVAARGKGTVLFGVDTRPLDGTVFRITLTDGVIDVGTPCPTPSGACAAIPSGVGALVDLLKAIDGEQLALEPCTGLFD